MNTDRFIEILESTGTDVRTDYSGRSMYGKTCVGVEVDNVAYLLTLGAEAMQSVVDNEDEQDELLAIFRRTREDSLGRNQIVYWPAMETEEADDD